MGGENDSGTAPPSVGRPRKVYVEPTNRCNLACRTCMRRAWDEPEGVMEWATFAAVVDGLRPLEPAATISFAGLGEPLLHDRLVDMVALAREAGLRTEMTTNALLLDRELGRALVAAGLDQVVVSIDGSSAETFDAVRPGASLERVLANVEALDDHSRPYYQPPLTIGIEFVAMRSNVRELPGLWSLAMRIHAAFIIVTNLLPHTAEMAAETLYDRSATATDHQGSAWLPRWSLPRMDVDDETGPVLLKVARHAAALSFLDLDLSGRASHCPFVHAGALAVAWDGTVSPCPPLLHSHRCLVMGREKEVHRCVLGHVPDRTLAEIWRDPDYVALRERVLAFDFPPCTDCGGCDLAESNQEDCFGNPFPACGDCLWARGILRCP